MLVLCVEIFIRRDMVVSIGRVASGKIEGTTLSLLPLQQHLERLPDFSFRHGVFTLAVSMQKLALRFEACGFHFEVFAPCYEIVEIHIDGQILFAKALIDFAAFDSFLAIVGAQRPGGPTVVNLFGVATVVDREQ